MSWASENQDHPIVKSLIEHGCTIDEIPDEVRLIGLDRPPEAVFAYFRKRLGLDPVTGEPLAATDADRSET